MSQSYNASIVNKLINDFQNGKKNESIIALSNFLKENPKDNIARYNLALMQSETKNIEPAIINYKRVIKNDPRHWKSKFNLYLLLIEKKYFEDANHLIDEVLKLNVDFQPALRDKALVLVNLKKPDVALNFILKSLKINPNDYIALNTLGIVYLELKKYSDAENIFNKAIQINSEYVSSYNNIGRCYSLQNKKDKALKFFFTALEKDSNYLDAINNIANNYSETGKYEKALDYYFRALNLDKNNNEIIFNIGCAYVFLKNYKKAEEYYKKSLKINPHNSLLHKNISILYLALHRFEEAWKYFDGRHEIDNFKHINHHFHNIKDKLWKGEKITKKTKILVVKEQGIGDEILYGTMYRDLLDKFPNTIIETEPRLLSIFKRSLKSEKFISYGDITKCKSAIKKFDTIIYAGSLGRLFRNTIQDFPESNFLFCDKKLKEKIGNQLKKFKNIKKIGISWRSKNKNYGTSKSLNLDTLQPILKFKDVFFFNLQYGETEEEINDFYKKTKIKINNIDKLDLFNDFESIAALLKNLDLFISVSNSTAHLSGALGVPTWLIKPKEHAVFHYWNQPSNSTPWYKSIKLYNYENNWKNTILDVKNDLIKFINPNS